MTDTFDSDLDGWTYLEEAVPGIVKVGSTSPVLQHSSENGGSLYLNGYDVGFGVYNFVAGAVKTFNKSSNDSWTDISLDYRSLGTLTVTNIVKNILKYKIRDASDNVLLTGSIYSSDSVGNSGWQTDYTIDLSSITADQIKVYIYTPDSWIADFNHSFYLDNVDVQSDAVVDTAPDAPTNLVTTSITTSSVSLSWTPPTGGSAVSGYLIYRKLSTETSFKPILHTHNTAIVDNAVVRDTNYVYKVNSYNNTAQSSDSNELSVTTLTVSIPDAPTGLTASIVGGKVVLDWDDPSNEDITGYQILRKIQTDSSYTIVNDNTGTDSNGYTNVVTEGNTYVYIIKAKSSAGLSAQSNSVSIVVPVSTVPDAITDLAVTLSVNDTQVNANWSAPDDGGSPITGYKVETKFDSEIYQVVYERLNRTFYLQSFGNTPVKGRTFYIRVSVINKKGTGASSEESIVFPTSVPDVIDDLIATSITGLQVDLDWTTPYSGGDDITSYKVYRRLNSATTFTLLSTITNTNITAYSDMTVSQGMSYVYYVAAINSTGEGASTGTLALVTPTTSTIPTILSIVRQDPTNETTDKTLLKFRIIFSEDVQGVNNTDFIVTGAGRVYLISHPIRNFSQYDIRCNVTGVGTLSLGIASDNNITSNSGGILDTTLPSNAQSYTVTLPSAPTNLIASSSDSTVTLSWDDPSNTSIIGYQILRRIQGESSSLSTLVSNTGSRANSYIDTTVVEGKTYIYRIKVRTVVGLSNQSNFANITVLNTSTVPDPPTNLTGSISGSYFSLNWNEPDNDGGQSVTRYKLQRKSGTGGYSTIITTGSSIYSDTTFSQDSIYTWRVFAINSIGQSKSSNEFSYSPLSHEKTSFIFKYNITQDSNVRKKPTFNFEFIQKLHAVLE